MNHAILITKGKRKYTHLTLRHLLDNQGQKIPTPDLTGLETPLAALSFERLQHAPGLNLRYGGTLWPLRLHGDSIYAVHPYATLNPTTQDYELAPSQPAPDTYKISDLDILDVLSQLARNGVWGTCTGCPKTKEQQPLTITEACEFFDRYDHKLSAKDATEQILLRHKQANPNEPR